VNLLGCAQNPDRLWAAEPIAGLDSRSRLDPESLGHEGRGHDAAVASEPESGTRAHIYPRRLELINDEGQPSGG
jgi:hypothetical protein